MPHGWEYAQSREMDFFLRLFPAFTLYSLSRAHLRLRYFFSFKVKTVGYSRTDWMAKVFGFLARCPETYELCQHDVSDWNCLFRDGYLRSDGFLGGLVPSLIETVTPQVRHPNDRSAVLQKSRGSGFRENCALTFLYCLIASAICPSTYALPVFSDAENGVALPRL